MPCLPWVECTFIFVVPFGQRQSLQVALLIPREHPGASDSVQISFSNVKPREGHPPLY